MPKTAPAKSCAASSLLFPTAWTQATSPRSQIRTSVEQVRQIVQGRERGPIAEGPADIKLFGEER